ncbi:MAG: hypothetical protein ACXVNN_09350 [Bacteroidia bacterium]
MKTILVSLSLMLAFGLTIVHAGDNPHLNKKIIESFKKNFTGAEFVQWENVNDYQQATFVFLGHRLVAYFNIDGELLGSARVLQFSELPMAVVKSLDKRYSGADYPEVLEISNNDGTSYRLLMERQNKRSHVAVDSNGTIMQIFTK